MEVCSTGNHEVDLRTDRTEDIAQEKKTLQIENGRSSDDWQVKNK